MVVELRKDKNNNLTVDWELQNFSQTFSLKEKVPSAVTVRQNGSKHFLLTMIEIRRA